MMTNKVYVITGATSGIGYAILNELCKENIIFAGYRNAEKINRLMKKRQGSGDAP